jgi:YHS domain-containing protein
VLRYLALVVVALLVFLILRASMTAFMAGLRGATRSPGRGPALRDELVKDPVCETYLPRRKAIARTAAGTTRYFCSVGCAEKFTPTP